MLLFGRDIYCEIATEISSNDLLQKRISLSDFLARKLSCLVGMALGPIPYSAGWSSDFPSLQPAGYCERD